MIEMIYADLLDVDADVIVNPWNRNIIPWWLLLPQGVSGSIKRRGGNLPFKELAKYGPMPLGSARLTAAGNLRFKAIIHVAGINIFWFASEYSVRESVRNALLLASENNFMSIAFPLIGSGSGNRGRQWSKKIILDELQKNNFDMKVFLVEYRNASNPAM